MVIVQKYGGSSVSDVAAIEAVAARVVATVAEGHQVVVVVSAMGKTTDELLGLARRVTAAPTRRELDLLISVGERVSMTLLAMAIEGRGIPAESFTGSQAGIITDEGHARAQVLEVRPRRVQAALDAGKVAIVAGFQGVSREGNVTTLGRGGSDTTAVVLTAALGAAWCEICSDVDGIYTADPRVVADAKRHESLPLDAALALAQAGSRVLAREAIEQAQRWGVILRAQATTDPSGWGTRLEPGAVPPEPVGVASLAQALWIEGPLEQLVDLPCAWVALDSSGRGVCSLVDAPEWRPDGLTSRPVHAITVVGGRFQSDKLRQLRSSLGAPFFMAATALCTVVPPESGGAAQRDLHRIFIGDTLGA